jgi:alkanesulfonate monooxygenase SsuD/methylene tetrahydromethanopterin reductase-like flavin-dependent oxidoreductase (luciferase family)
VFSAVPREGFPDDLWDDLRELKERYDYYWHGQAAADHAAALTEQALDAVAIAGTPEEAVPRFRELVALGVDGFVIPAQMPDPHAFVRVLAERVIPAL